jgi:hypothetical protein
LLGRSEATLPTIESIAKAPPGLPAAAEACTLPGERRLVLITSSWTFREARQSLTKCGETDALRYSASVIVHEDWHVNHGADEDGQLTDPQRQAGPAACDQRKGSNGGHEDRI